MGQNHSSQPAWPIEGIDPILFEMEHTVTNRRLSVVTMDPILALIRRSSKAPDIADLKKTGAITLSRLGSAVTRVGFNISKPTKPKQGNMDARMQGLAHLLTALNAETPAQLRDPLLQVALGGSASGFGMRARVVLPARALPAREAIARYADAFRHETAGRLAYRPAAPGTKIELGGDIRRGNALWGVWIDVNPWRGIRESARQLQPDGSVVVSMEGIGLTSHTQQMLCVAGLGAIVHAVRNPADALPAAATG